MAKLEFFFEILISMLKCYKFSNFSKFKILEQTLIIGFIIMNHSSLTNFLNIWFKNITFFVQFC